MNGELLQTKAPQFFPNPKDPESPCAPEIQAPLKQLVVGPGQVPGYLTLGTVQVPFSPNDLVLWQQHMPRLRDDPEKVVHTI